MRATAILMGGLCLTLLFLNVLPLIANLYMKHFKHETPGTIGRPPGMYVHSRHAF